MNPKDMYVGGAGGWLAVIAMLLSGGFPGCQQTPINQLTVMFDPNPVVVDSGQVVTIFVITKDGTTPFTYKWDWSGPEGTGYSDGPAFTVTPEEWFIGPVEFKIKVMVTDANGYVATAEKLVTVGSPKSPPSDNHPPVANAQVVNTAYQTPVEITLTGSDPDGDDLTGVVVTNPSYGHLTGDIPYLTYTPDNGFSGPDSFTFTVNDGTVDSAAATVIINVGPPPVVDDHVPLANDQSLSTAYQTPIDITLTGSDPDGNAITFVVVTTSHGGEISGDAPDLVYTPDNGFSGTDSFTFAVNDGTLDSAVATVIITVGKGPDVSRPTTVTLSASPLTGPASLMVDFTATAACDQTRTIASYAWDFTGSGTFVADSDQPTYTYVAVGTYIATVKAIDSAGGFAMSSVTITVTAAPPFTSTKVLATADVSCGPAPLTVNFTTTSGCDSTRTITGFFWDFGDGLKPGTDKATHVYDTPGTYEATCKVVDSEGGFAISTVEITVN